jgi:biotin operon repressor
MKKFPTNFEYLKDMYQDQYFPSSCVNKLRDLIKELVTYLENEQHSNDEIQSELDRVVININNLQEEFEQNGSEIETVARESIATTIQEVLKYFDVDIEIEEAIRERDW